MSRDIKLSALRLPKPLHGQIVAAAQGNNRSQHAEMLHRMEASFEEPMMETEQALAVLNKVAENVITDVLSRLFTGIEDRLAELIAKKMEAAEMSLITEVRIDGDAEGFADAVRNFDFTTGKRRFSPTGRLSDPQPQLQDLPAVSGMSTLAASFRKHGCLCGGGMVGETSYVYHGDEKDLQSKPWKVGGFFNGGFCGTPDGEVPQILEPGERVIDLSKYEQFEGRTIRWIDNVGSRPQELKPNDEIEIMTRPHGLTQKTLVGDVHPSSWVSHGSKLPHVWKWRPTTVTVNVMCTADGEWTENTGSMPVPPTIGVQVMVDGKIGRTGKASSFEWSLEDDAEPGDISHWRLAE